MVGGPGFEPGASRSRTVQRASPTVTPSHELAPPELAGRRLSPGWSPAATACPWDFALSLLSAGYYTPTTTRFVLTRERHGRPMKSRPPLAPTAARSLAAPVGAGCPSTSTLGLKDSGRPRQSMSRSSTPMSLTSPETPPPAGLGCQFSCHPAADRPDRRPRRPGRSTERAQSGEGGSDPSCPHAGSASLRRYFAGISTTGISRC